MVDPKEVVARYRVREVAGIFRDWSRLEECVRDLQAAGFDRSQINLLASKEQAERRLGRPITDVHEVEEAPEAPVDAPVLDEDRKLVALDLAGMLTLVGSFALLGPVVATGGGLAAAISAALAGGAAGGTVGALLARWLEESWAERIAGQLEAGGVLLLVSVRDPGQEKKAREILERFGAEDAHVHEIERVWTEEDLPFAKVQPDPFLITD